MFPAYYIFNFLLSILLVLHVIWTYYILKIAYRSLFIGMVRKQKYLLLGIQLFQLSKNKFQTEDSRSDSEDDTISSTLETLDQDKEDAFEGYSKKEN